MRGESPSSVWPRRVDARRELRNWMAAVHHLHALAHELVRRHVRRAAAHARIDGLRLQALVKECVGAQGRNLNLTRIAGI